jgi:hypothetical protein
MRLLGVLGLWCCRLLLLQQHLLTLQGREAASAPWCCRLLLLHQQLLV